MYKNNLHLTLALCLVSVPVLTYGANVETPATYSAYEGVVLGGKRSATEAAASQASQIPGDIYRGTVFGAEQKDYPSEILGNRPMAKSKLVYDTSLVRAVKISDADRVRTLLYAKVDPNEKNYAGITPLAIAAEKGNMDIIRLLVETGKADVNAPSSYGVTPLIAAAAAGKGEVITYLLQNGANSTDKDDLGKTALLYASMFDEPKALSALISLDKLAINLPDNTGNTPLIYSAQRGHLNNVKILLANGAKVDYRNPSTGLSALAAASAEGHLDVVKMLLKQPGIDVNLPDSAGRTPIFYAVEQDHSDVLRTLLSAGANPNAKDLGGVSALMHASAKNRQECQKVLLRQKGIEVDARDNAGRSVVAYGAFSADVTPVKELVSAKADINVADLAGNTPLMNAIKAKNDRTALFLIQQGANLTAVNQAGETAFTLVDQFLPNSAAANVLAVKKQTVEQQALQVEAEKLAAVRQLEEQLSQEEAAIGQLKEAQEAAARASLEQEYQAKTTALENQAAAVQAEADQRLSEAKEQVVAIQAPVEQAEQLPLTAEEQARQAQAATEAQIRQIQAEAEEQIRQAKAEAEELVRQAKAEAAAQVEAAKKQTAQTQQKAKQTKTVVKKTQTTTKQQYTKVKGEYIPKASVAPEEISMADLLGE